MMVWRGGRVGKKFIVGFRGGPRFVRRFYGYGFMIYDDGRPRRASMREYRRHYAKLRTKLGRRLRG